MKDILTHIQIANAFLCIILAIHLFSVSARRPLPVRLFGLNFLLFASQSLLLICVLQNIWPIIPQLRPCIAMILGPVFYLYSSSIYRPQAKLYKVDIYHFLPAVIVGAFFIAQSPLRFYIDGFIITSYCVYLTLVILRLKQGLAALTHLGEYAPIAFRGLTILSVLVFVNICLELSIFTEMNTGVTLAHSKSLLIGSIIFTLVNATTVFITLRRAAIIEWMYEFGASGSSIPQEGAKLLFEKWERLVMQEKVYLKEFGITLSAAAKKMGVPSRHLSNAVNQVYGGSFSQYLNDKRVEEAKRLFLESPARPITELMLDAGFNTKSNFNKEFLRVTNKSPSEYRKLITNNVNNG